MNKITKAMKNKTLKNGIKKIQKTAFVASIITTLMLTSATTAFATPPQGADTSTMNSLIDVVLWVVRGAVLFIGGVPSLIKIVQGHQNQDERERNGGIVGVAIAGIIVAATFAIKPILTSF